MPRWNVQDAGMMLKVYESNLNEVCPVSTEFITSHNACAKPTHIVVVVQQIVALIMSACERL